METKFTPGPWFVTASMESGPVHAGNGDVIVGYCEHNAGRMSAEQWANARLVAAAPEMYDILETLVGICDEPTDDHVFATDAVAVLSMWRELREKISA